LGGKLVTSILVLYLGFDTDSLEVSQQRWQVGWSLQLSHCQSHLKIALRSPIMT
jgi:hypothetical protein